MPVSSPTPTMFFGPAEPPGLGGAPAFTVPAARIYEVRFLSFANNHASAQRRVSAYARASGGAPTAAHLLIPQVLVDPREVVTIGVLWPLAAAWDFWLLDDGADVTVAVSGVTFTV